MFINVSIFHTIRVTGLKQWPGINQVPINYLIKLIGIIMSKIFGE